MRSNRRGKLSHRLKQRRQPWQMSKTRRSSASSLASSQKSGLVQSSAWRVGASRLPSRMPELSMTHKLEKAKGIQKMDPLPQGRSVEAVERLLEATGMALLGLGQGLEPVGDLLEALFARGPRHARIHVGVFVRLAGDRGLEIERGGADRLAGGGVAHDLEEFEMAMGVAGLALGGRAEDRRHVVVALDVGLLCEIEIAAVRLALARERVLQILL